MKTVQLSELEVIAEEVRNGETVEILDGETSLATVVPKETTAAGEVESKRPMTPEERLDQLVREGKAIRGTGKVPDWFFTAPRPESEDGSVLEQLLADRRKYDW